MVKFLVAFIFLLPLPVFASHTFCQFRFSPKLGFSFSMENNINGKIVWDDMNYCSDELCTEIYPGTFDLEFESIILESSTPKNTRFRIGAISPYNDLGNPFGHSELFKNFVQTADFIFYDGLPKTAQFQWGGEYYDLNCRFSK